MLGKYAQCYKNDKKTILTTCFCFDQQVNNSLIQKMNLLLETNFFGHNLWELNLKHTSFAVTSRSQ